MSEAPGENCRKLIKPHVTVVCLRSTCFDASDDAMLQLMWPQHVET